MARVYGKTEQEVDANIVPLKRAEFNVKNLSKMMSIMRDGLYKHKERTVVQEYISNARDAVREKYRLELFKENPELDPKKHQGAARLKAEKTLRKLIADKIQSSDIKVTIPSQLHPFFKVRDYGVGLSPDRVEQVFVNYCESTKDDSDVETGGFGIGAKSGWAYTDHFTVISYYEGKKYTYSAHTEKEAGVMDLDSVVDTNEANGVEIVISVNPKDIEIFKRAIMRICFFWETRPTFVGLTQADFPIWFNQKATVTFENWAFFDKQWADAIQSSRIFSEDTNKLLIVLDGVPYSEPLTSTLHSELSTISNNYNLIHFAELGSCDVIASREALSKTPKTTLYLSNLSTMPFFKHKLRKMYEDGKTIKDKMHTLASFITTFGKSFLHNPIGCQEWKTKGELFDYYPSTVSWRTKMHFELHSASTAVIYPVHVKINRNGDASYSFDSASMRPQVDLGDSISSIPVLLQDEQLSIANRRLKVESFYQTTKIKEFLLFDITNSPVTVEQFNTLFDTYQTSNFALATRERREVSRAKGVLTLYKLSFNYGHTPKDKIQEEPEYFDRIRNEKMVLLTEEEVRALGHYGTNSVKGTNKDELKNFQQLKCNFYQAAPTTIAKLQGKRNIYTLEEFIKDAEKIYTLEEKDFAGLYKVYHKELFNIISNFRIFLMHPNKENLIKSIKDKKLAKALKDTDSFIKMIDMNNTNVTSAFLEKHFPKKVKEVKEAPYNAILKVYQDALKNYSLLRLAPQSQYVEELITYINAKV